MNTLIKKIKIALFYLAGAVPATAQRATESDQLKLLLVGASAFITAGLAYFGAGFTVLTFQPDAPFVAWFVFAPLVACAALFLEYVLNATMSPGLEGRLKWLGALPRVIFSVLIGLTLAIPMKLAIFAGPVNAALNRKVELKAKQMREDDGKRIRVLSMQQANLNDKIEVRTASCDALQERLLDELDGTGGTGTVGMGAVAQHVQRELVSCRSALSTMKARYLAGQRTLDGLLDQQTEDVDLEIAQMKANEPRDLMARLGAYSRLASQNRTLYLAGLLIFLLLTSIDMIPTGIKAFTRFDSYVLAEKLEQLKIEMEVEAVYAARHTLVAEKVAVRVSKAKNEKDLAILRDKLNTVDKKLNLYYHAREGLEDQSFYYGMHEPLDMRVHNKVMEELREIVVLGDQANKYTRASKDEEWPGGISADRTAKTLRNNKSRLASLAPDRQSKKHYHIDRLI